MKRAVTRQLKFIPLLVAALPLGTSPPSAQTATASSRPHYAITAKVDYALMTLQASEQVTVPVAAGDSLTYVPLFIYADASGVGGADGRQRNISVDTITDQTGAAVPFTLEGALLRVKLPRPATSTLGLSINYHGVIPRSPAGSGGLAEMMGGLSGDLGGLLGGSAATPVKAPKNTDYGLYTFGNGVLSLGSFWYPVLAVRQGHAWADSAPEGLGDVAFAEMSDYDVSITAPSDVTVAATGDDERLEPAGDETVHRFAAHDVRDFSVLMSDKFAVARKTTTLGEHDVVVEAYTTRTNQLQSAKVLEVAASALQLYSRRFGPYPYRKFKIVEGPMRGGAGGMEFSGLVSIASMLYQDMGKQLGELAGSLGVANLDQAMAGMQDEAAPAKPAEAAGNPAGDLLKGLLGQQKGILDSLFEMTIAHEVAHQWWAIGVGSDSQHAPFVDESLTNYSAIVYFEDRYGAQKAGQMMDLHLKTAYSMGRMLGSADAPANLATAAYGNNMQYGAVVYGKGALYYAALRGLVGDQAFFTALREYYRQYRGSLSGFRTLLDLVKTAAPAHSAEIDALYKRWIEERHGDEDVAGGKTLDVSDLLGGLMGAGGEE